MHVLQTFIMQPLPQFTVAVIIHYGMQAGVHAGEYTAHIRCLTLSYQRREDTIALGAHAL